MGIKRTKLAAFLMALLAAFQATGIIVLPPETYQALVTVLGAGIAWFLRDAIGDRGMM